MAILVSAIITTYKRDPDIVMRAVRSVMEQSCKDLELIVVDDSPAAFAQRARVQESIEALDGNVRYIPHPKNLGACAARNTGLQAARGTYVAFLDDDDEWMPEKIEKQLQAFTDDRISLVYCGCINRNDCSGTDTIENAKTYSGYVFDRLIIDNFVGSTSFPLIRKDRLLQIGGFDPQMKSAQDFDVWLRLAESGMFGCVEEPLVIYHIHGGQRITTTPLCRIQGQERLIQKNAGYLKTHRKAWWTRHIRLAPEYASNRQLGTALGLWIRAVIRCPQRIPTNLEMLLRVFWRYLNAVRSTAFRK